MQQLNDVDPELGADRANVQPTSGASSNATMHKTLRGPLVPVMAALSVLRIAALCRRFAAPA